MEIGGLNSYHRSAAASGVHEFSFSQHGRKENIVRNADGFWTLMCDA